MATFGDGLCAGCKANPKPAQPAPTPRAGDVPPPMPSPDDFVGRMIPTGNQPALVAYYVSFGALLPAVGLIAAVVAIIAGVKGVKLERAHPEVRGGLHAWFGIVFSVVCTCGWIAVWLLFFSVTRR